MMITKLHIYHSISWRKNFKNWWTSGEVTGKMMIVSCAPFALHFCAQTCWFCKISWITCVLRSETATNRCYVNRQINVSFHISNYQTALDQFWLNDWQTDTISEWPTADHVRHFAVTAFLCSGSCVQWVMGFFYMADVNNFLLLN